MKEIDIDMAEEERVLGNENRELAMSNRTL